MTILEKAIEVAIIAHRGQTRMDGATPYIVHPLSVAMMLPSGASMEQKAAAVLHDVLEDTRFATNDLIDAGIPELIVKMVWELTRKEKETYWEFISRISTSTLPVQDIKIADIMHNIISLPEGHGLHKRYNRALDAMGVDKTSREFYRRVYGKACLF